MSMFGKLYRSQQFEKRARQRRGLTEGEALAIAARARRGEETRNKEQIRPSLRLLPSSLLLLPCP